MIEYLKLIALGIVTLFLIVMGNWAGYKIYSIAPGLAILFWIIIQLTVATLLYSDYQDIKRRKREEEARR